MKNKETLEEAAERFAVNRSSADVFRKAHREDFIRGAKWQQEQDKNKYSEEEVVHIVQRLMYDVHCGGICEGDKLIDFKISPIKWFEQYKKK